MPKNLIDTILYNRTDSRLCHFSLCRILENEGITRGMEKMEYLVLLFESGHSFITYFFKNMQVYFLAGLLFLTNRIEFRDTSRQFKYSRLSPPSDETPARRNEM